MKLTYGKAEYEVDDGKYVARFLGVTMRDPTGQLGRDGKPMGPAMTWDFEITEGPAAGKKVDKLTSRSPTPKSSCGKLLAAVCDSVLKDGTEVDLAQFVGRSYRITVQENRVSDSPPPILIHQGPAPAPAPAPTPPVPGAAPPPPQAERKFWFFDGNPGTPPALMTFSQVQTMYQQEKVDWGRSMLCPEGQTAYQPIGLVIPESNKWVPF